MKNLILVAFFLSGLFAISQNTTVASGEKLVYTASYNMSGIMTELAQLTMETSEVNTSSSTLLRLKCSAVTYSKWDGFFKIRDLYESYVSPTSLKPYLYKRDIDEGGYYKFMQYKFKYKNSTVSCLKKKKRKDGTISEENTTVKITDGTRDIVSTIYHIRNMDIHKAKEGDAQDFKFLFDNEEKVVSVKYLKKEIIETKLGKKECYKLAISLKNDAILKGNNDNLLWLTADANKIPVYAKFKIAIGTGELRINSATGLKH